MDQRIELPDKRVLEFSQFGDLKGKPLFIFHGWPGSKLGAGRYNALAQKLHIRIISPNRPGYGLSTYKENRTLLDWPQDVLALANYLKIKKFAVMGVSGGGPYALACAYKIPKRLTKVGIVVGLGPTHIPHILDQMPFMTRMGWKHYGNPIVRTAGALLHFINARYGPKLGFHRLFFGAKSDRALYNDASIRKALAQSTADAFHNGYKGPRHDLKIYSEPWGFDLADIHARTYLWYGDQDQNVPLAMGRFLSAWIPGCTYKVYFGEGHLLSITHAEEILRTLTE
jgi:pimeloyl-ACP methyl ester carboxylesterase